MTIQAHDLHVDQAKVKYVAVIPARYGSTRFPGKPLAKILGKPMILHVLAAARAAGASQLIVATDHPQIADVVSAAGGEVCMTSADHQSGTERLAEVVASFQMADETIIVNVQGDEPLIPPQLIRQVAEVLAQGAADVVTLATPLQSIAALFDPNVVKVVTDRNGYALYFSRAAIPWDRQHFTTIENGAMATNDSKLGGAAPATVALPDVILAHGYQRHIGLYAYRAAFIRHYSRWAVTPLERIESLEQLRILWYGKKMQVSTALVPAPLGVDTPEDLVQAAQLLAAVQRKPSC